MPVTRSDDAAMIKACMDLVGLHGGRVRPPRRDVDASLRPGLLVAIERLRGALEAEAPSAVGISHATEERHVR